jgi:Rrf2 family iron-sulfur cluster assembly transcriptional regulator
MWLSTTAQNSLHAVLCIAGSADDGPVRVDEIAAVLGRPRNYLSKTLHTLVHAGVLLSTRGPTGGFQLAEKPERLTLARVIAPFEPLGERRCLVGRATCGDAHPCAAHRRWSTVAANVEKFLNKTTIATLLSDNPRATRASREMIRSARLSNRRKPHGSVKR